MLRHSVKIVYDAHEIYPAMVAGKIPHILYTLVRWVDKIFIRVADCVIIPSEERKIFYTYARRLIVVPNTPKFTEIREEPKEGEFSIFYGGELSRENGILIMIKAIIGIPHVKLTLAGDGPLRRVIERICKKNNNLKYLGLINQKDVLKNLARADVTFVFYEPTNINNMYPASNKLFEAMMVGVPVIANRETSLSKIIEKYKCGILVPYGDVQILKNELIKLKRNPLLRKTLGENGKKAFKENFAWDLIEKRFINCYQEMLYRN